MTDNKTRKVFLVDDDSSHNQMMKDHLMSKMNVDITTFSTGEDCLGNLEQQPNVIVLDYYLDGEKTDAQNGLEILKKIKSTSPNVEVVMLTVQDKLEVAVETMKNGAFDYVVKNTTAFVRTQNAVANIFKNLKLQENLKAYKFAAIFLSVSILLIIIIAIILRVTGIATEYPGWIGGL